MSQSKPGRKPPRAAVTDLPRPCRRDIVRRIGKSESLAAPETTVRLDPGRHVLPTKSAALGSGKRCQGARDPKRVAKLNAFVGRQVLLQDKVLRDVPVMHRA